MNKNVSLVNSISNFINLVDDGVFSAYIIKHGDGYECRMGKPVVLSDEELVYSYGSFINSSANMLPDELYNIIIFPERGACKHKNTHRQSISSRVCDDCGREVCNG